MCVLQSPSSHQHSHCITLSKAHDTWPGAHPMHEQCHADCHPAFHLTVTEQHAPAATAGASMQSRTRSLTRALAGRTILSRTLPGGQSPGACRTAAGPPAGPSSVEARVFGWHSTHGSCAGGGCQTSFRDGDVNGRCSRSEAATAGAAPPGSSSGSCGRTSRQCTGATACCRAMPCCNSPRRQRPLARAAASLHAAACCPCSLTMPSGPTLQQVLVQARAQLPQARCCCATAAVEAWPGHGGRQPGATPARRTGYAWFRGPCGTPRPSSLHPALLCMHGDAATGGPRHAGHPRGLAALASVLVPGCLPTSELREVLGSASIHIGLPDRPPARPARVGLDHEHDAPVRWYVPSQTSMRG